MQIQTQTDLVEIADLLAQCGLSSLDLADGAAFWSIRYQGTLIAVIGLETHGKTGLLRSLAVQPDFQQRGIARCLLSALEDVAIRDKLQALYLLTTTAAGFFARYHYQQIERTSAPSEIQATRQFEALCPASAKLMVKYLAS